MSKIRINRTLNPGEHRCIVTAPFGTNVIVTALNPVLGMNPGPDGDSNSNVWNSIITVPKKAQYTFLIVTDHAIAENQLIIQFIEQGDGGSNGGGGNNNSNNNSSSNLDGPEAPTVGWRFTYGIPNPSIPDLHVTVNDLNGKYIINYSGMWACSLIKGKVFECVNIANNGMKANGNFSNDWKSIWFHGNTLPLIKKEKI